MALACEKPPESERPVSHWTATELAQEAVKRAIVEKISALEFISYYNKTLAKPFIWKFQGYPEVA